MKKNGLNKLLSLLLALVMVLSLAACGNKAQDNGSADKDAGAVTDTDNNTGDNGDGIVHALGNSHRLPQQAEALAGREEVGDGNAGHEGGRNRADPVVALVLRQIHGSRPQSDHGQSLVGPAEVTPDGRCGKRYHRR